MIKEKLNKTDELDKEFNYVVQNQFFQETDIGILFGDEDVVFVQTYTDMYDLLVLSAVFQSKSLARKCWNKTGKKMPDGFNDFEKIGKNRKRITIWNPIS